MDHLNILMWSIPIGFTFMFSLLMLLWNHINNLFEKLDKKIDKLDEKATDIDRRLCRLEGAFSSKDCCMIKDDRHHHQKAE